VRFCAGAERRSGTRGYRLVPTGVFPLPSMPWQAAQWRRKEFRPSCRKAEVAATGFFLSRSARGIERFRTPRAMRASHRGTGALARNPRPIKETYCQHSQQRDRKKKQNQPLSHGLLNVREREHLCQLGVRWVASNRARVASICPRVQ
jgi:hypothetical protein